MQPVALPPEMREATRSALDVQDNGSGRHGGLSIVRLCFMLFLWLCGCASDSEGVAWAARFDCRSDEVAASERVVLGIAPGGCPVTEEPIYEVSIEPGQVPALPPGELPDGRYAFYARGFDAAGRATVSDCATVRLPRVGGVELVLQGRGACTKGDRSPLAVSDGGADGGCEGGACPLSCATSDDCPLDLACEQGACVPCSSGDCSPQSSDQPAIEMSKMTYAADESIVVHFRNLPGGRKDWVGLYMAGASHKDYLGYLYTEGATEGSFTFPPLAAGSYEARLFFDDSYTLEQTVTFSVE